jgi:hypothetical protein
MNIVRLKLGPRGLEGWRVLTLICRLEAGSVHAHHLVGLFVKGTAIGCGVSHLRWLWLQLTHPVALFTRWLLGHPLDLQIDAKHGQKVAV